MMVYSSSLPVIMVRDRRYLEKTESPLKLAAGPITPKAGPTLPRQVAAVERPSIMFSPSRIVSVLPTNFAQEIGFAKLASMVSKYE